MNDLIEYEEKPIEGDLLSEEEEALIFEDAPMLVEDMEISRRMQAQGMANGASRLDIELANARRQSQASDDISDENMAIRQAEGLASLAGGLGSNFGDLGLGQAANQAGQFQGEEIEKFKERVRKKRESKETIKNIIAFAMGILFFTGWATLYYIDYTNNL